MAESVTSAEDGLRLRPERRSGGLGVWVQRHLQSFFFALTTIR